MTEFLMCGVIIWAGLLYGAHWRFIYGWKPFLYKEYPHIRQIDFIPGLISDILLFIIFLVYANTILPVYALNVVNIAYPIVILFYVTVLVYPQLIKIESIKNSNWYKPLNMLFYVKGLYIYSGREKPFSININFFERIFHWSVMIALTIMHGYTVYSYACFLINDSIYAVCLLMIVPFLASMWVRNIKPLVHAS